MPTLDRLAFTAPLSRFRAGMNRLWRAAMARHPAVRVGLVLLVVLGVVAAGYFATLALVPSGSRELAPGQSFSQEDTLKITQALHAQGISYHADDRRIEVAVEQFDQARAVFSKLRVGPMPLDDIRRPPDWLSSLVETPQDRERNERYSLERLIEHYIDDLEGVISSVVTIQYPRPGALRHLRARPSALVRLETESNRRIPSRTLDVIPTILIRNEPELSRESITVIDRDGHIYLDPSNPKAADSSRDQAREDEVRTEVLKNLSTIKGVQVFVKLSDRRDDPMPGSATTASAKVESSRGDPAPAMGINEPIDLVAEPASPAAAHPSPAARAERGRILITVPRSYYYNHMYPPPEDRQPTQDELRVMAARTREHVLKLVSMAVPESWSVEVDTFADDLPLGPRAILTAGSDARRKVMDWGIVAVIAAAVALVTALASWFQAVRRPARFAEPEVHSRRYRVDSGDEPNPSDRVRELVRRDPEAAASVLQRWATQGGPAS